MSAAVVPAVALALLVGLFALKGRRTFHLDATMTFDPQRHPVDVVVPFVDGRVPGFAEAYRDVVGHDPVPCQVRTLAS